MAELTEVETAILDLERRMENVQRSQAGLKGTLIAETFGWNETRYYQALNRLIDRPEALAHSPILVRRLQRLRTTRARHRTGRVLPRTA